MLSTLGGLHRMALGLALMFACTGSALAERVKFAAIIAPKADVTLAFADGSQHVVRLVQREGKVTGDAPLTGATMLEWGLHDLAPASGGGDGLGYLVFTRSEADIAYVRFQWRIIGAGEAGGVPQYLMSGFWEVVGATGALKGLTGLGTMRINMLSATQREWLFDGDLLQRAPPAALAK